MKNNNKIMLLVVTIMTTFFGAKSAHLTNELLLAARLNGAQQVPAVNTTALGVAGFSLNGTMDTLCFKITVSGLSGMISSAHIHEGVAGTTGAVLLDLDPYISGNTMTGSLYGANLTPQILKKYLAGMLYINVHTAANPNGEIRGQILLETDDSYVTTIDGMQQVPMLMTNAHGLGVFKLTKSGQRMNFLIIADSLSGAINAAHLHMGAVGVSGGVAIDLSPFISGNMIAGEFDPSSIITDLKAGNIYINMHTTANPNGEIRGQLYRKNNFAFDAKINGAQEVPAVTTMASGVADIQLNFTKDTMWFDMVTNQVSDTIHGAHLHNAAAGANGGVLLDLTPFIIGNKIKGMITGASLTPMLITEMLEGNVYVNMHTTLNPNGEIRGQILRYAREGYTMNINGMQQVPVTNSMAIGSGIVSIDREQQEAHYMTVIDGTTATGVHFHLGQLGVSGSVLYDLSSNFMNNGSFGYWTKTDATTPFTTAQSLRFRNDSVYINFHNMTFPNGEIRGQVDRGYNCYQSTPLATQDFLEKTIVNLAPNPMGNYLQLNANESIQFTINDMLGKVIKQGNFNSGINTIDVSMLQNGIYFIQLKAANKQVQTTRLLKY